jgi:hypothetical protein
MAASTSEISDALQTALGQIDGLRVVEYLPDSLNPPMATRAIDSVRYHTAFGYGTPLYTFTISVVVARSSDRIAQQRLGEYLSPTGNSSIRAAVEKDPTLGDTVQSCQVVSAGNIVSLNVNDVLFLVVEFTVEVYP